jgi:tetratricopeptide (TPR) repeat protein
MKVASSCVLAFALAACAPHLPPAYVHARDAAEFDYAEGRFDDAAKTWLDAARDADTARDRSEARYRAATSYERAGHVDQARALYSLLASGKSDRAARSTFALADLRIAGGDETGGYSDLEAAVRKYPASGVANLALRRYCAFLADHGGDSAVLSYLDRAIPELTATAVAEQLMYERARRLDAMSATRDALTAYVAVATRFPYPYGAYWDDALFRGAACETRLGDAHGALRLLQRMLAAREVSHLSGSYERPLFADAAYRVAELYRDDLNDPEAARRAFHQVYLDYPTSTLQDDALWQEALLAHSSSQTAACEPLALLVAQLPDSRFAPCAHELCATLHPMAERQCHDYIRQELLGGSKHDQAD